MTGDIMTIKIKRSDCDYLIAALIEHKRRTESQLQETICDGTQDETLQAQHVHARACTLVDLVTLYRDIYDAAGGDIYAG